jgi:hypothetical protein
MRREDGDLADELWFVRRQDSRGAIFCPLWTRKGKK